MLSRLSGRSFIPMISSFACAVPGIMASRTVEDRQDRIATILVSPLMSCSARIPVYVILIAAFTISMLLPDCPAGEKCYYEVYPLILCGVGYSIYASVIWGSIPYTVEPKTVGTAYGICTAIQNIGLAYAPWQVSSIINMR